MPVYLFPGQGAQFTGMGIDLDIADSDGSTGVRSLFDLASGLFGSDIRQLLNSDAEVLKRTDMSQVAITVASLAAVRALSYRGIKPSACAGFSLGEYSALAVSGVISEADAIRLTIERGRIMQKVAESINSATAATSSAGHANTLADAPASASEASSTAGMSAVLGLSSVAVDQVIMTGLANGTFKANSIFAANYNSPLQTVISGTEESLVAAEVAFKAAGARRAIRLKVAGPFHSPLMIKAGEEFAKVLESVTFADPAIPLFSNVTGKRITSGAEAKKCAVAHISSPVRWTEEEEAIAALMASISETELVEVGPGKVLSGLWADSKQAGSCKPYTEILNP